MSAKDRLMVLGYVCLVVFCTAEVATATWALVSWTAVGFAVGILVVLSGVFVTVVLVCFAVAEAPRRGDEHPKPYEAGQPGKPKRTDPPITPEGPSRTDTS